MWLDYKGKRHFLPTEMPEEPLLMQKKLFTSISYTLQIAIHIQMIAFEYILHYSGTLVKTKIDKFLNVSGSRHCSIEQQCREVALCWRDVPDG